MKREKRGLSKTYAIEMNCLRLLNWWNALKQGGTVTGIHNQI